MNKKDNINKINYKKSIIDKESKILAYYKQTIHQDTILTIPIPIKTPIQKQIQKRRARTLKNNQTQIQHNIDNNKDIKDIKDIDDVNNKKHSTHTQTKKFVIMD